MKTRRSKDPTYSDPKIIWVPSALTDVKDGSLSLPASLCGRQPLSATDYQQPAESPGLVGSGGPMRFSEGLGDSATPNTGRGGTVNTAQRSSPAACIRERMVQIPWAQHSSSEMLRVTYSPTEGCWHLLHTLSFAQEKCFIILHSHTCQ